jgi:hypothetical protein
MTRCTGLSCRNRRGSRQLKRNGNLPFPWRWTTEPESCDEMDHSAKRGKAGCHAAGAKFIDGVHQDRPKAFFSLKRQATAGGRLIIDRSIHNI